MRGRHVGLRHVASRVGRGRQRVERRADVREHRGQRHRGRERRDHAHVGELVVPRMEPTDLLRRERADALRCAALREGERMIAPVDESPERVPSEGAR